MFDVLDSPLVGTRGQNACPTVAATPRTVRAAFTKESDAFAAAGVEYFDPLLNVADRRLFALQMLETWEPVIGVSRAENQYAVDAGFAALEAFWRGLRRRSRAVLDRIEREHRLGIVALGRPYHHDPGIYHGILEELQKRGYPVADFETRAADISVDHADVVENYRTAHEIARANERGSANTEDLRRALVHYRSLFDELLEVQRQPEPVDVHR
jgi:predicted nucleotide-binding protein (sugar kinase/HSP70/actin superfamily)